MIFKKLWIGLVSLSLITPVFATTDWHAKAADMLKQSVAIPTVIGRNKVPELANYLADVFKQAGVPAQDIHIIPYGHTAALIVRFAAQHPTKKPIMVMAHMDVVEAKREDWSQDPFIMTEKDGYYYGRGTLDMKHGLVATSVALLKLKAENFKANRDIILFFTGDEETGGIGALKGATEWKALLNVEYGLNADAGGGAKTPDGQVIGFGIQTAEKTYTDFSLTVKNRGGHSSKPRTDNAIYSLVNALHRIETHRFAPQLNETTQAYFTERQKQEKGALGDAMRAWLKNPSDDKAADIIEASETENGLTRTTCVATKLMAGHANNALAQLATANINCRIMPGVEPETIKAELEKVISDKDVVVAKKSIWPASKGSPLRNDIMRAYADAIHARYPAAPILPDMSTGATDARPFRSAGIPIYGVDGAWAINPDDMRAHGRDERLPVQALSEDVDHWELMLKKLAS